MLPSPDRHSRNQLLRFAKADHPVCERSIIRGLNGRSQNSKVGRGNDTCSELEFPISTSGSRIVFFSCPRPNQLASRPVPKLRLPLCARLAALGEQCCSSACLPHESGVAEAATQSFALSRWVADAIESWKCGM